MPLDLADRRLDKVFQLGAKLRIVGLGRFLMNRILEWMRVRGFKKAELCVFASNTRARRLYESLGFLEEGIRRRRVRIRDAYEDEVFMGLWLGE